MHTNLTVEENLLFSARIRLPAHYSHAQHVFHVERAIQVSPLCQCLHISASHLVLEKRNGDGKGPFK